MTTRMLNPGQMGEQLKMFMRPGELMSYVNFSYEGHLDPLMAVKEQEARLPKGPEHGSGVYDSIAKEGYQGEHIGIHSGHPEINPNRRYISDAHHRLAAAAAVERDTGRAIHIPVEYVGPSRLSGGGPLFGPSYKERYPQNVREDT